MAASHCGRKASLSACYSQNDTTILFHVGIFASTAIVLTGGSTHSAQPCIHIQWCNNGAHIVLAFAG